MISQKASKPRDHLQAWKTLFVACLKSVCRKSKLWQQQALIRNVLKYPAEMHSGQQAQLFKVDPNDWQAFRDHVQAIGAPDPGDEEADDFHAV